MNLHTARIIEDFEVIHALEPDDKCHLEIKQCPLKYEMFRRPSLVFKRDTGSYVNTKDYNSENHNHFLEVHMYVCKAVSRNFTGMYVVQIDVKRARRCTMICNKSKCSWIFWLNDPQPP